MLWKIWTWAWTILGGSGHLIMIRAWIRWAWQETSCGGEDVDEVSDGSASSRRLLVAALPAVGLRNHGALRRAMSLHILIGGPTCHSTCTAVASVSVAGISALLVVVVLF